MPASELRKVGIVIANATFADAARLPNLKYPLQDADQLANILSDKNYGRFDNIIPVLNETSTTIRRQVESSVRSNRDAFLLIYYSGHGKIGEDGRLFLAASDTNVDFLFTSGVRFKDLVDIVEGYNHRRVGFILDCCYAGAAVSDLRGTTEDEVKAVTAGKQVFVLCGSSSIQTAKELDALGHGVLTAGILSGIQSGAADRDDDGIITLNDLFQFCSEFASRHSHQEPVCANWLTGIELPIARVSRRLVQSEIDAIRARIAFVKENSLLDEELVYRLTAYFGGSDIPKPRKNSLEDAFIDYCANRISYPTLLKKLESPSPITPEMDHPI